MAGTKIARLGVLFNAKPDADLSSLLFVKVFEFTLSSYGLVHQNILKHFFLEGKHTMLCMQKLQHK